MVDNMERIQICKCGNVPELIVGKVLGFPMFYRYVCPECNIHSKPCENEKDAIKVWNQKITSEDSKNGYLQILW